MRIKGFCIGMSGEDAYSLVNKEYKNVFQPFQFSLDVEEYNNREGNYFEGELVWLSNVLKYPHEIIEQDGYTDQLMEFEGPIMLSDGIYWGKYDIFAYFYLGNTPNITFDENGNVISYKFTFKECEMLFGVTLDTFGGTRSDWELFIRSFMNAYEIPRMDYTPLALITGNMGEYSFSAPEGIKISINTLYDRLIVEKAVVTSQSRFD